MKPKRQITLAMTITAILVTAGLLLSGCSTNGLKSGATQISPKDGMVMVYVPAGDFLMGAPYTGELQESKTERGRFIVDNEDPQHTVTLDAFWIDQTEVTQEMFARCVESGDCKQPSCANKGENLPVICVTWKDANDYCEWAGRQLPTEAQWEKAARGTDGRTYPWGNQPASCEVAVINDGTGSGFCGQGNAAWAVGSKPKGASPYGALDMAGNVWEWVADWYSDEYYQDSPASNPTGPEQGQYRIARGGGEYDYYWYDVRTTARQHRRATWRDLNLGFRCAATPEP